MFDDHPHVIARQGDTPGTLSVLAQRQEVMWRDGSAVHLHPVCCGAVPMLTHRALASTTGTLLLVDLARMVPALDAELRAAAPRDITGLVFYSLRQAYVSADAFCADVQRHTTGTWWPVPTGYTWQAAPRALDRSPLHRRPGLGTWVSA